MEAAPWLVGPPDEEAPVEPKELYEKLRPFKDPVADDLEGSAEGGGDRR